MYDIVFQRGLLKRFATDYKYCLDYSSLIPVEAFDTKIISTTFTLLTNYVTKYEKEVPKEDLMQLVNNHVVSKGIDDSTRVMLQDEVKKIYTSADSNPEFMTDQLVRWLKRDRLLNTIEEIAIKMENDGEEFDFDAIPSIVENSVSVDCGVDAGYTGDYLEEGFLQEYRDTYSPKNLVKIGYSTYEDACNGGLAPGELHVVMAPPKTGKSTFGCNAGAGALMYKKNVYHITLEITESAVFAKYACRFAGIPYDELLTIDPQDFKDKLKKFSKFKSNLFVKHFEEGTASCNMLRAWISSKRNETGKDPDLIIVDYDDCLVPSRKTGGGEANMYMDGGSVYTDLINMAKYFECPVLTFAQPVREAWNKFEKTGELIYCGEISHSGRKIHKATSISSLNFKKNNDMGILYVDINRRGKGNTKVPIRRELDLALFKQEDVNISG